MSLEKLAKVLHVDEVKLMHGPKGVAVHVRIDKSWHSAAIDNAELKERRLEVIAEHIVFLADGLIHKVREELRKGAAQLEAERVVASIQPDDRFRKLSWGDVPITNPFDGTPQQQVRRTEIPYMRPVWLDAEDAAYPEPVVDEPMESRFHAVMAELRCL